MTSYIETKINEVNDPDFRRLISELCLSVGLDKNEFENRTLANLFTAIVTETRTPDLNRTLVCQILEKKVKDLAPDSVIQAICNELASRKKVPMDNFAGKSIFALIKQCYRAVCPPKSKPKKLNRLQKQHIFETRLINRRRRNGSY